MQRSAFIQIFLLILFTCAGQVTHGAVSCSDLYHYETIARSKFESTNYLDLIHEFAEATAQKNMTNAYHQLAEGIRNSGLDPSRIPGSLYYATRLLELSNLFSFLNKISMDGKRDIIVLKGSSLEEKLEYPARKARIPFSTFDLKSFKQSIFKQTLLLTPFDALVLAESSTAVKALKRMKSTGLKILVSDQIENGITQFNFNNPTAIGRSLAYQDPQRALKSVAVLDDLNIGIQVDSVFFDPEEAPPKQIIFNLIHPGFKTLEEISAKIQRNPPEIEASLRQSVNAKISGQKRERLLRFMIENVHLENLSTTNARVGRMLKKARAYARENNFDEIYFYSGKGGKSPDIIKRILVEGYGVGKDKFFNHGTSSPDDWIGSPRTRNPLILVIDDFIGTGNQMELRLQAVREIMSELGFSSGVAHAFAPIVTPTGASKISKIAQLFFDLVIPENVNRNFPDLNLSADYSKDASTAIFFEYMAPDNNVIGIREFFYFWTWRHLEVNSTN